MTEKKKKTKKANTGNKPTISKKTKSTRTKVRVNKKKEFLTLSTLIFSVIIICLICILLVPNDKKWTQDGNIITKGEESYQIGQYYDYDETSNGKIKNLTNVKWKVLGIDEKGNLLIVSASSVENLKLGENGNLATTQRDYIEGVSRINAIAEKYGHGDNAIDARSITAEDINKITKFDVNELNLYGKNTTYYWGENANPKAQVANNEMVDITIPHYNKFIWFDNQNNKWIISEKDETKDYSELEKIVTLQTNRIMYNNFRLDEKLEDYKLYLNPISLEYNMLFVEDGGEKAEYWTTNRSIIATERYAGFGYTIVRGADVNYTTMVYSGGQTFDATAGVRVVVTID